MLRLPEVPAADEPAAADVGVEYELLPIEIDDELDIRLRPALALLGPPEESSFGDGCDGLVRWYTSSIEAALSSLGQLDDELRDPLAAKTVVLGVYGRIDELTRSAVSADRGICDRLDYSLLVLNDYDLGPLGADLRRIAMGFGLDTEWAPAARLDFALRAAEGLDNIVEVDLGEDN